jgi:hypothetical protein
MQGEKCMMMHDVKMTRKIKRTNNSNIGDFFLGRYNNPNYGSVVNDYYYFFSIYCSTFVGEPYVLVAIMEECH